MVSACVLIRTQSGRFEDAVKTIEKIASIDRVFPVLGRYDIVADIEARNSKVLGAVILRLSKISGIVFTETLVEIQYQEDKKC